MITDVWVDKQRLDLYSDTNIKYTFQVNDIAEVKNRQASFTNSFTIPRTPNNIQIFGGLGIASDTSMIPYQKPSCQVKIDGFDLIVKGWLNVTETDDEYKIYIYSGIINFFKAIENKNLSDLELNEIEHSKNVETVISSFRNEFYRYIFSDYNGRITFGASNDIINIDQIMPSVRVKYLFNKIHSKYGFSGIGNFKSDENFDNLWMTYTKAEGDSKYTVVFESKTNSGSGTMNRPGPAVMDSNIYGKLFNFKNTGNQIIDRYEIEKDGYYRFELNLELSTPITYPVPYSPFKVYYIVTDSNIDFSNTLYDQIANGVAKQIGLDILDGQPNRTAVLKTDAIKANKGQYVLFFYYWKNNYYTLTYDLDIKIEYKDDATINPYAELNDFKITDFLKEVINFFGLTMFSDENSNEIEYKTLNERLNTENIIDWTDKFIGRSSEKYVYNTYAQRNNFEYNYSDINLSHNNGYILVNNQNLEESKAVFKSKLYSPEENNTDITIGNENILVPIFKCYDKEPKEDTVNPITYKPLQKRYFFLQSKSLNQDVRIGSKNIGDSSTKNSNIICYANFDNLKMQNIISRYYRSYGQILNESRIHNINLNLNLTDILTLNFDALYYFSQEQQYYILNKLNFDDKTGKGEFIRVHKPYTSVSISLSDSDIICIDVNGQVSCRMPLIISVGGYIPDNMKVERLVDGIWVEETGLIPQSGSIYYYIDTSTGTAFRVKYTSQTGQTKYSNIVKY